MPLHILLIQGEPSFYGGAERTFELYVKGLRALGVDITVAGVPESRAMQSIPLDLARLDILGNRPFSPIGFFSDARRLLGAHRRKPIDVIHAWTARDWDLAAVARHLTGRPAIGTLHDHPCADYIRPRRSRLMAWHGRRGLNRVICVSESVRSACVAAGYPERRLGVICNGLPPTALMEKAESPRARLGYLGSISEEKGLPGLFKMLELYSERSKVSWSLRIGGDLRPPEAQRLRNLLEEQYGRHAWWPQVHWNGWVSDPRTFLAEIDLLVFPSTLFDCFPTVLLEAGLSATAALATDVGGVREIIRHDKTGWIFPAGDWAVGAGILSQVSSDPQRLKNAGFAGWKRVTTELSLERMVEAYGRVYHELSRVP